MAKNVVSVDKHQQAKKTGKCIANKANQQAVQADKAAKAPKKSPKKMKAQKKAQKRKAQRKKA